MWWGVLVIGVMVALVFVGIGRGERRARRSARRAAARFGLSVDERALHLDGTVDGCTVVAQVAADATGGVLDVVVRPSGGVPASLGPGRRGGCRRRCGWWGGDVVTGDAAFDGGGVRMAGERRWCWRRWGRRIGG
ncbi:MAG: hypothetical protein R3F65_27145 [bacterium]